MWLQALDSGAETRILARMTKADLPPLPQTPAAAPLFLTLEDAEILRRGLRGVQSVEVRQFGGPASAADEIAAFLELEGVQSTTTRIKLMAPPPLRRFVFRYSGTSAVLTIAPELER